MESLTPNEMERLEIEMGLGVDDVGDVMGPSGRRGRDGTMRPGSPSLLLAPRSPRKKRTMCGGCCSWAWAGRTVAGVAFVVLVLALVNCNARSGEVRRSLPVTCSGEEGRGKHSKVRNVVFMIPDGMGPNYLNLTKEFMLRAGRADNSMALDEIEYGLIRTRSLDSAITDSAAAATAYATGRRTNNTHLSELDGEPFPTVLEGAEAAGMWTGLVSTARITHATPAAYSSHIYLRDLENDIAQQQLEQGIEVLMGGGRRHFLPKNSPGSHRTDRADLEYVAKAKGYNVLHTAEELETAAIPVLGLFADSHMSFEIDRAQDTKQQGEMENEPSLAEMTRKALQLLAAAPQGFFLMVEGGRIDHAGHYNDPAAVVHEVLAYDEAVRAVINFARFDGNTLVVSAADHETGGLMEAPGTEEQEEHTEGRIGAPDYEALARVTASAERTADEVHAAILEAADDGRDPSETLKGVLEGRGIDASAIPKADVTALVDTADAVGLEYLEAGLPHALGQALSATVGVEWTTGHHTATDIQLYATGNEGLEWPEILDNRELGLKVIEALGVDTAKGYDFTHNGSPGNCNLA